MNANPTHEDVIKAVSEDPPDRPSQSFRVLRDNGMDLEFHGWELGRGQYTSGETQIATFIYLTTGGSIVTSSLYAGPGGTKRRAMCHERPMEALEELFEKGKLPRSAKAAWESMCRSWAPFASLETERIA